MTILRPARPSSFSFMYVGPRLHAVDRALEQTRGERAAGVGDDADADLGRGDADVGRGEVLAPPPPPPLWPVAGRRALP